LLRTDTYPGNAGAVTTAWLCSSPPDMMRGFGSPEIIVSLIMAIFWICVLWAVVTGVRALQSIGTALQKIAVEMERRNQVRVSNSGD
jgi:hypothetical protein